MTSRIASCLSLRLLRRRVCGFSRPSPRSSVLTLLSPRCGHRVFECRWPVMGCVDIETVSGSIGRRGKHRSSVSRIRGIESRSWRLDSVRTSKINSEQRFASAAPGRGPDANLFRRPRGGATSTAISISGTHAARRGCGSPHAVRRVPAAVGGASRRRRPAARRGRSWRRLGARRRGATPALPAAPSNTSPSRPGDSLWSLAEQIAPDADPRDVVDDDRPAQRARRRRGRRARASGSRSRVVP